ncbi:hypothetical protein DFP72DRAFT_764888, partial [Ephemerocybe angulata]
EALIPFGLLTAIFGTAGTLLNVSTHFQNLGRLRDFSEGPFDLDKWEESMLERDRRLTGHKRGRKCTYHTPLQ